MPDEKPPPTQDEIREEQFLSILKDALVRVDDEIGGEPVEKLEGLRLWVERLQVVINETREKVK